MPRHEDLTANVQRTREELRRIGYSLSEIDSVIDGYPPLNRRLYVPLGQELPHRSDVILGRHVTMYDIPAGFDATNSSYRRETLEQIRHEQFLYGEPDPDLPTGGDWLLPENHPSVVRAIKDRCRDFTQHRQPLVPGWKELLALQTEDGDNLGMPTGIGWYTHLWLSDMCDALTYRLSKDRKDLEVLLYRRPGDPQSEPVWATPGGYVVKGDTYIDGVTPLQAASARRTQFWAKREVSAYNGVPVRVKFPISSGNTIVAGLRTTPYARFIFKPNYISEPTLRPVHGRIARTAGFISLRDLAEFNPTGGTSGKSQGNNPLPIWTTHFEYVVAGLDAITNPESQYRLGLSNEQLLQTQAVAEHLQATYPMFQPL